MKDWIATGTWGRSILGGATGVILAGLLFLGALHLYTDHQALHALVDLVNAEMAQRQKQAPGR